MIRRQLIGTLVFALTCCATTLAYGAPLFTRSLTIDRSANIFKTDLFSLKIDLSEGLTKPVTNSVFTNVVVSPSTPAGTTFELKPGDGGFAELAAQLTDAANQAMKFVMTEISSGRPEGRGYTQASLFSKKIENGEPADFIGETIRKVELVFNQFTLIPPPPAGSQPVSSGKPVELKFTFNIYAVPEPSSLGMMGVAALAAAAAARKRRG